MFDWILFLKFLILCNFKNISGSWRWGICPWATPIRSESSLFCWSRWKCDSVGSGKRSQNSILLQYGNYQSLHFIVVKDLGTSCRNSAYHKGNPFRSLFRYILSLSFKKELCIVHLYLDVKFKRKLCILTVHVIVVITNLVSKIVLTVILWETQKYKDTK